MTQAYEAETGVMTIMIRADMAVRVHGIPWDLTEVEAERICRVIRAMAMQDRDDGLKDTPHA